MTIRRATPADLPAIMALEAACFDAPERWGAPAWRAELSGDARLVLVADQGVVIAAACFHLAGETAELYRVMTAPASQGIGLATLLLAGGLAWASSSGATEMLLEVRLDNRARALYADAGFAPLYERTNYYGPGLHAQVMCRPIGDDAHE